MHETNVHFSVESTYAYDDKENKNVSCAGSQSSNRATATFACLLTG